MAKLLMLIAEGLEECEALVTRDVLLRGGIEVHLKSIMPQNIVMSQDGLMIMCDGSIVGTTLSEYDGVILPGGGRGTQNLDKFPMMDEILEFFNKDHKLLAAICAAPMVLGHRGYLKNKKFTCFKGCEAGLDGIYTGDPLTRDDNIITARSMHYASEFGIEIINYFLGREKANRVYNSIRSI